MTVLVTGPVKEQLDEAMLTPPGPVSVQVGAPVGASEPVTPTIFPVNVMIWPPAVLDCKAVTLSVGVAGATKMLSSEELAEL